MAESAAITAVAVGTGLQIKGNLDASRAQAANLRAEAESRRSQAQELLRRGNIQLKNIKLQGGQLIGEQNTITAAKGFDVGSGSSLAIMEETQRKLVDQFVEAERELESQAAALLSGASSFDEASKRVSRAGDINAIASALSGSSRLFLAAGGGNKATGG